MPLPTLLPPLPSTAVYPDNIVACLEFEMPGALDRREFFHSLRREGFRNRSRTGQRRRGCWGSIDVGGFAETCNVAVRISWSGDNAPLRAYVDLNALSRIHQERGDDDQEYSLDRKINWLHPNRVRRNNGFVCNHVDSLVNVIRTALREFLGNITLAMGRHSHPTPRGTHYTEIEVTADFLASSPQEAVQSLEPAFRALFRHQISEDGRQSARGYTIRRDDVRILRGFRVRDEEYVCYPKTNRRIRLECRLTSYSIGQICSRLHVLPSRLPFGRLFQHLAEHVTRWFNQLLAEAQVSDQTSEHSWAELVSAICCRVRNLNTAAQILLSLVAEGRVTTTTVPYDVLANLVGQGVLRHSSRRIYVLENEWLSALEVLRRVNPLLLIAHLIVAMRGLRRKAEPCGEVCASCPIRVSVGSAELQPISVASA